jgi:imidazolonepropionase-like amidohydrolase
MVLGGMPPIEAIQAATITNAFLLGIDNEVGQIKEGFLADIIAVNENPLLKINTLENVLFVMKDGVIYKN